MGPMKLSEWYFHWTNWKLWRNTYQSKYKTDLGYTVAFDVYNRVTWHIGPLKIKFKQFVDTYYELKAREAPEDFAGNG